MTIYQQRDPMDLSKFTMQLTEKQFLLGTITEVVSHLILDWAPQPRINLTGPFAIKV
jgi:hypothetical protein